MVKPIGNLVANLTPKDKISAKTKARFGPQSALAPGRAPAVPTPTTSPSAAKPIKYKKRKR